MMLSKKVLLNAVLLTTLGVPMLSFAQQEVDPTYYDPWAPSIKVVARANAKPTESSKLRKVNAASTARPKTKKQTRTEDARRADQTATIASSRPVR